MHIDTTTRGPCGRGDPWRWKGCSSLTSPPGIETLMTEFRGRVYTLPGGRRDCAVRLPIRICRRTGILGGTKDGPLMKNSVPFYRNQSAILRTVHGAYTASVCVEAEGATYQGEVQVQVHVSAARVGLARLLPRPG